MKECRRGGTILLAGEGIAARVLPAYCLLMVAASNGSTPSKRCCVSTGVTTSCVSMFHVLSDLKFWIELRRDSPLGSVWLWLCETPSRREDIASLPMICLHSRVGADLERRILTQRRAAARKEKWTSYTRASRTPSVRSHWYLCGSPSLLLYPRQESFLNAPFECHGLESLRRRTVPWQLRAHCG